jgi:hypothetical protein
MKTLLNHFKKYLKPIGLLVLVAILSAACSKKEDPAPKLDPPETVSVPFGQLVTVSNLMTDTSDADPTSTARKPVLYSLEQNKEVPLEYAKTALWDLSFTGIYNSFLGGNNGINQKNLGYGGSGKGGIYIVKQKFEDVKTIPADNLFVMINGAYGTDDTGAFGNGTGWYFYDYGGSKYPDDPNKAHVVYPIEDRTLIVRTANGNYAKIRMVSLYKDLTNPADWQTHSPHPYYTFQYILAKKGSNSFN